MSEINGIDHVAMRFGVPISTLKKRWGVVIKGGDANQQIPEGGGCYHPIIFGAPPTSHLSS